MWGHFYSNYYILLPGLCGSHIIMQNSFFSSFKYLHSFSVSTLFKKQRFEVSSETDDILLNCHTNKKSKGRSYFQHTIAQNIYYHSQIRKVSHWIQARPKTRRTNSKFCISMFDVKPFFRSQTPFNFIDYSTLVRFVLVPHQVCRFP